MSQIQSAQLFQRAVAFFNAKRLSQAKAICEELVKLNKKDANALDLLGQIAFGRGTYDEAASYLTRSAALQPRDPRAHVLLGDVLTYQGKYREALARYDRALRLEPKHPRAIAGKAELYEKRGDRQRARALLEPIVRAGGESPEMAVVQARLDLHEGDHDAVIELAGRQLERGEAEGSTRWHLFFLRGKALERAGRFDDAFGAYQEANDAIRKEGGRFDAGFLIRHTDELLAAYSAKRMAELPRAAHGSELGVFVLGMPRSGSTLIESILGAHPEAHAAGELATMQEIVNGMALRIGSTLPYPACVEDLGRDDVEELSRTYLEHASSLNRRAARLIDKYLVNYRHLGLIALLFPEARVIHCVRNPLDTCLSCFAEPLPPVPHPYASDLGDLGATYLQYERLMRHWREVLQIPILDVRYEDLVAHQERITRQVVDFCGLSWDDRCLRYWESGRIARTASYDQVNRPIYNRSVARHRHFAAQLAPLERVLTQA